jgi:hypothetical protein
VPDQQSSRKHSSKEHSKEDEAEVPTSAADRANHQVEITDDLLEEIDLVLENSGIYEQYVQKGGQ